MRNARALVTPLLFFSSHPPSLATAGTLSRPLQPQLIPCLGRANTGAFVGMKHRLCRGRPSSRLYSQGTSCDFKLILTHPHLHFPLLTCCRFLALALHMSIQGRAHPNGGRGCAALRRWRSLGGPWQMLGWALVTPCCSTGKGYSTLSTVPLGTALGGDPIYASV